MQHIPWTVSPLQPPSPLLDQASKKEVGSKSSEDWPLGSMNRGEKACYFKDFHISYFCSGPVCTILLK